MALLNGKSTTASTSTSSGNQPVVKGTQINQKLHDNDVSKGQQNLSNEPGGKLYNGDFYTYLKTKPESHYDLDKTILGAASQLKYRK